MRASISLSAMIQIFAILLLITINLLVVYKLICNKNEVSREIASLNGLYDLNVLISLSPIIYGSIEYQAENLNLPYLWIRGNAKEVTDNDISNIQFIFGVTKDRLDFWSSLAYIYYCSDPGIWGMHPITYLLGAKYPITPSGIFWGAVLYFTGHSTDPKICIEGTPYGNLGYYLLKFFDSTIGNFFRWLASPILCLLGSCDQCNFPVENYDPNAYELLDQGSEHVVIDTSKKFIPILTLNPVFYLGISEKGRGFLAYFNYHNDKCSTGYFQTLGERAEDNCKEECGYEVLHVLKDVKMVKYKKYFDLNSHRLVYDITFS